MPPLCPTGLNLQILISVLYEFQHGTISYDTDQLETLFSIQFLTNILASVILIMTLILI